MSVVTKTCWHCDRCGHEWLVQVVNKPPIFCSKCHQRNWNRDTKQPAPSSKVVHAIYTSRSGERSTTYCGRDIESVTTAGVDANDEVVLDGITCKLCLRHNEGHGGDDVRPLNDAAVLNPSTPFVQIPTSISQQKALKACTQESDDVFTEEEAAIYNEHVRVTETTLRVPLTFVPVLVEKLTDYFLSNNTHDRAYKHGSAAQNLARALTDGRYKLLLSKASPNGHKDTSDDLMQRLDRETKLE